MGLLLILALAPGDLFAQTGQTKPGSWSPDIAEARRADQLWETIRQTDRNSTEFRQAWTELNQLVEGLRQDYRVPVAAAMMEWGGDDVINTTALKFFGRDGLPLDDVREIVFNPERSWKQRVLVRSYFHFVRPEYETALSEKTRRRMLHMLAQRLVDLAGYDHVSYGEQRLLGHMLQAALARYANKDDDVAELSEIMRAMRTYIAKKRPGDALAVSIAAWLELADRPAFRIRNERDALLAMGHWDPLISNQATAYLQQQIRNDPAVAERVFLQFNDPRDEVRAAACQVFGQTLKYKPEQVIPKLVDLLVNDRGAIVHRAAADALINHADQAAQTIELLLKVLRTREPKPGPKRTESILLTLSHLVLENPRLDRTMKQQLLNVAVDELDFAPEGALKLLESLGPFGKPAVAAIKEYRDTKADLYMRQMINRHVLMAIDPQAVGAGG
jgi:hypothetical protein